jgi:hypothetical protein
VQLPVKTDLWKKLTVVGRTSVIVAQPKSVSVLILIVLSKGFGAAVVVVVGEMNVDGAMVVADAPSPTKLDSEKGEQPTKPGAVSPTDSHSC